MVDEECLYIVINEQMCLIFVDTSKPIGNYVDKIVNLLGRPPKSCLLKFTLNGNIINQSTIWKNVNGILNVVVDKNV
jgi:hypothetical protein